MEPQYQYSKGRKERRKGKRTEKKIKKKGEEKIECKEKNMHPVTCNSPLMKEKKEEEREGKDRKQRKKRTQPTAARPQVTHKARPQAKPRRGRWHDGEFCIVPSYYY